MATRTLRSGIKCKAHGCKNLAAAKEVCLKHWKRLKRHGSLDLPPRQKPFLERFLERINKTDACWLWTGETSYGYGTLNQDGSTKGILAHRFSYKHFVGPIPDGLCVLHRCDNPPCVRPDHLFTGTRGDNNRDMAAKGRNRWTADFLTADKNRVKGSKHHNAKLTDRKILSIRSRRKMGGILADLSRKYGVGISTISRICRHEAWKHIGESK